MEALREITGEKFPAHIYLLDGSTLIAYKKWGTEEPYYFKNGIKGFDKRGRKFEKVDVKQFKQVKSTTITIKGSNGKEYQLDPDAKTCTCPGFAFRGSCKHLAEYG